MKGNSSVRQKHIQQIHSRDDTKAKEERLFHRQYRSWFIFCLRIGFRYQSFQVSHLVN